jgi:hypothetical protein
MFGKKCRQQLVTYVAHVWRKQCAARLQDGARYSTGGVWRALLGARSSENLCVRYILSPRNMNVEQDDLASHTEIQTLPEVARCTVEWLMK